MNLIKYAITTLTCINSNIFKKIIMKHCFSAMCETMSTCATGL